MRKGIIYVCVNMFDGRRYIGQTVQGFDKRKNDHIKDAENGSTFYFHRAIRKFGKENFIWSILEKNVKQIELNDREKYYISKYKTNNPQNGYNMTDGGNASYNSILSDEDVKEIKRLLKTTDMLMSDIAKLYNINGSNISDINCGETYFDYSENYPLRVNKYSHNLTKEKVFEIYELLKLGKSFKTISKLYGISITNVSNINLGKIHRFLDDTDYPINNKTYTHLGEETIKDIVYLLTTTNLSHKEIGDRLGITRESIKNVNSGYYNKSILEKLGYTNFPIRALKTKSDEHRNKIINIIKSIVNTNKPLVNIANEFDVSKNVVGNINRGVSYADIAMELGYNSYPLRQK